MTHSMQFFYDFCQFRVILLVVAEEMLEQRGLIACQLDGVDVSHIACKPFNFNDFKLHTVKFLFFQSAKLGKNSDISKFFIINLIQIFYI